MSVDFHCIAPSPPRPSPLVSPSTVAAAAAAAAAVCTHDLCTLYDRHVQRQFNCCARNGRRSLDETVQTTNGVALSLSLSLSLSPPLTSTLSPLSLTLSNVPSHLRLQGPLQSAAPPLAPPPRRHRRRRGNHHSSHRHRRPLLLLRPNRHRQIHHHHHHLLPRRCIDGARPGARGRGRSGVYRQVI